MGYFVNIVDSTFTIPTANLDETYRRWCELNQRDDLKRGGTFGADAPTDEQRAAWGYNPNRWFSWMDPNYPETCADTEAIARMLGFDCSLDDDGLHLWSYNNKTGQEDLFLTVISDLATGYIVWQGEDGERWKETYGADEAYTWGVPTGVTVQRAVVAFGEPELRTVADFRTHTHS